MRFSGNNKKRKKDPRLGLFAQEIESFRGISQTTADIHWKTLLNVRLRSCTKIIITDLIIFKVN